MKEWLAMFPESREVKALLGENLYRIARFGNAASTDAVVIWALDTDTKAAGVAASAAAGAPAADPMTEKAVAIKNKMEIANGRYIRPIDAAALDVLAGALREAREDGVRAERAGQEKFNADVHERWSKDRAAMEFAINHLSSMRNYSLVEGACHALEGALGEDKP